MTWELYEVWAVNSSGHEDLIDTTKSLKEAREIAEINLSDEVYECIVYKEDENGDLVELERIS